MIQIVPIAAVVMGIGVAFWSIYWQHQLKRLQYEERRLMIERGLTPPPVPLEPTRRTAEDALRQGVVLTSLGIGLGIGYMVRPNAGLALGGVIVGFYGLGQLLYYFIVKRREVNPPANS